MATDIDTVFTTAGIANVNFFNDRVLTSEDMRDLAMADADHRRTLGRSIGEGVAAGLRVSAAGGRSVDVSAGLAVNALGDVISLPVDVAVDLGSAATPGGGSPDALFTECAGSASDALAIGGAVYLLTIRPASAESGQAPRADVDGVARSCGPRHTLEGVRFRRVAVDVAALLTDAQADPGPAGLIGTGSINLLRSFLAHAFLGSPWLERATVDPFGPEPLRRAWDLTGLEECEVPIAVVALRGSTVVFVDEWGVRRPPTGYDGQSIAVAPEAWEQLLHPATAATGLASIRQFEDQLAARLATDAEDVVAVQNFRYLPGAGLLPATPRIVGADPLATTVPFLAGIPHRAGLTVSLDRVQEALRSGAETVAVDTFFPQTELLVFEVLGGDPAYRLFVHDGHWLATEIALAEVSREIADLRSRVAALEDDAEPQAGVIVTGPKETASIKEGQTLLLRFGVTVKTAGRYVIEQPTLTFPSGGRLPPTTMTVVGGNSFETDGRERRTIDVHLTWRTVTGPIFGLRTGLPDEPQLFPIGPTVGAAADTGFGGGFGIGGPLVGGDFGIADQPGGGGLTDFVPSGSLIGVVRLTVASDEEAFDVSDAGDATVVFQA